MNLFKILERCRENAEKWAWEHNKTCGGPKDETWRLSKESWQDWRTLESEILASIDEEQAHMLQIDLEPMSIKDRQEALRDAAKILKDNPELSTGLIKNLSTDAPTVESSQGETEKPV